MNVRTTPDDELTLYHYGEAPRRDRIDQHLQACESCAATYRDLARTLALVGDLDVPERDERYGLEVWQRIRHDLPPQEAGPSRWWSGLARDPRCRWLGHPLVAVFAVALLAIVVCGWRTRSQDSARTGSRSRASCGASSTTCARC